MDQLSFFPNLPPPAAPRARAPFRHRDVLFFGIRLAELGPEVADIYGMLRPSHGLAGIPCQPSRLHVSLLRVGERDKLTDHDLKELRQAASRVSFRPFPIVFETVLSFDGNARPDERRPVVFPLLTEPPKLSR
ncbi:MAG: 2'-5' RNA ligase family protein [Devosia sp.]